jgi:FAD/FMN-containing dehydrogenase/Fe-S oxidoreductase
MRQPQDIASDIRNIVKCEVFDDKWQRALYAADSSIYEVLPLCVIIPKTETDVVKTIQYAHQHRIPVTIRGGGTSLAGQAVNNSIIIDFSKYLNQLIEVNPDKNYVVVEPGINKTELDIILRGLGKFFPPDPSSSDFCTIGGMISNNASGPHTVKYGSVIDYIISIRAVLSNGEIIETRPVKMGSDEWQRLVGGNTLESQIYRKTSVLIQENYQYIKKKAPKVRKNCSGYQLGHLLKNGSFDLGTLFAASEGTLGVVLQAKLRIIDIPVSKGTMVLQFGSLEKMGKAITKVLETGPSAVELLDYHVIEMAAAAYPELRKDLPENVRAILLVEFDGMNQKAVKDNLKVLNETVVKRSHLVLRALSTLSIIEAKHFWALRKKSLPYVMKMRRDGRHPTPFIEDIVIQPDHLIVFIKQLYNIYQKYGVEGVVYGHAGDGQLHTRPLLNLKKEADVSLLAKIADEVFRLVIRSGGSITGEHGDGLIRSQYVRSMFGNRIYNLFKELKVTFDPKNILNPNRKIFENSDAWRQNLRYGPSYRRRQINSVLNWKIEGNQMREMITGFRKELNYEDEVELCHGCGNCRELTPGRMCPVFKSYHNELDSCRGRLSILRWLLKSNGLSTRFAETEEYRDIIFDHCVQCKMCLIECPSNVNVGKLMAEARARYSYQKNIPKGYGVFADMDRYAELCRRFVPLSNLLFNNSIFRRILEWNLGIDRRRPFPPLKRKTFAQISKGRSSVIETRTQKKSVVFFYDTFVNYFRPDIGVSITKILEKNGYSVLFPPQRSSALSALIEGSPDIGKTIAAYNVSNLAPYTEQDIPIITFSPSSGVALKMEYLNVLKTKEAKSVASSTFDIHEFLFALHRKGDLVHRLKPIKKRIYLHLHCHDLVQQIDRDIKGLLNLVPSLEFDVIEKGCCGIGGAFGFVKDRYERSLKIGEPLIEAVRLADREVYSTGESCAMQIEAGSGRKIGLTIDILSEAYDLS